jgi:AAA+ ATPase superfamily predicted ATPase
MLNAFSSKTVITNPSELFGRETVLNQLISLANNGNSVAIIGPRRFGKSSVLRCVETSLKTDSKFKSSIF